MEKKNVVLIVSPDNELLEVRARMFVESQKKAGVKPVIKTYEEVSIDEALEETSQGVLFGGIEFLWYRDLARLTDSEVERLYKKLTEASHRNILITVHESRQNLKRWKVFESIPNVKLVVYSENEIKLYEKVLLNLAVSEGFKISLKAVHTLIDRCGGSVSSAYSELQKLMLYKAEEKVITEKDVVEFVSVLSEVKVFDFINSVFSKSFGMALKQLNDLVAGGEKPEAVFYILLQQFSNFLTVAIDYKAGLKVSEIQKETSLNLWQITKKFIPFSEKWTPKELVETYWLLLKIDGKIKKGLIRDYSLAIKLFLLQLILKQPVSLPA